jgi:hypothetical protein
VSGYEDDTSLATAKLECCFVLFLFVKLSEELGHRAMCDRPTGGGAGERSATSLPKNTTESSGLSADALGGLADEILGMMDEPAKVSAAVVVDDVGAK